MRDEYDYFDFQPSALLDAILKSASTKGWVDIEKDYYRLLKDILNNKRNDCTIEDLNEQLLFLQEKLVEYLKGQDKAKRNNKIYEIIYDSIYLRDLSYDDRLALKNSFAGGPILNDEPIEINNEIANKTMLLSFNYTDTVDLYYSRNMSTINYIHGSLKNSDHIIFGFGDELDKDMQNILDKDDNRYLKNVKSAKYAETGNYRELEEFLQSDKFQVFTMGHSCGLSDRTLLNTIFEHENCVCIKPFYHQKSKDTDDYSDIIMNIYRNFTDKKLFRQRIVNKEQCEPLPQCAKE